MLRGFKDFIMRGNLVELAVAVIIATAFGAVVTTFTDVLLSIISKIVGGPPNFDSIVLFKSENEAGEIVGVPIGVFMTALVTFVIIAAVVYFFVVTPYNRLQEMRAKGEDEPSTPAPDIALLTEIRDLLAAQQGKSSS